MGPVEPFERVFDFHDHGGTIIDMAAELSAWKGEKYETYLDCHYCSPYSDDGAFGLFRGGAARLRP